MHGFCLGEEIFFHRFFSVSSVTDDKANLKLSRTEMWKQYYLPVAEQSYSLASEKIVLKISHSFILTLPLGG